MKKVYLDVGNTTLTLAERAGLDWKILFRETIDQAEKNLNDILSLQEEIHIVTGSVRKDVTKLIRSLFSEEKFTVLRSSDIPEKYLNYKTPETLGIDRFLTCFGAVHLYKSDVIVVDAGSACTVDLMTNGNIYQGGVIFPGLRFLHQSVKTGLPELPAVDSNIPQHWPGKSTEECLQWGLNGMYIQTIQYFVQKFLKSNESSTVVVTGGDSDQVFHYLNREMEVHKAPFLIFEGMRAFEKFE